MPVQLPLIPIIPIDSDEARNVEVTSTLCRIFYQPSGYQRTAKKLYQTSQNAGYDFTLDEVEDWLERQAVHQIHKPRPRFIPRVSFSSIQVPNEVHQADILYMPYDKVGHVTYLFCLNIVDIASRYKESVPIGSTSVKDRQGILTSHTIARAFEKKNQPVLYWLIDDDGKESERSFVREELLVIPDDTELPPQWVLMN
ncbi:unnamed protein product [Rhizophagus irregularis]|nr:unnamed protein product [Rhizophagus irregularis]CAB5207708.1 unnamed protein product [Rhizophagus irregularis]